MRSKALAARLPAEILLAFDAPGFRLRLQDCPDHIVSAILHMFGSLRPRIQSEASGISADGQLIWSGDFYRWRVPTRPISKSWARRIASSDYRVVADIHDVTIDWFLADHPDWLCLHAAAIETGAGLLCFPAAGRAGKSTLCAQLVAAGAKFWTDDILPVSPHTGLARSLALPLALRRPFPASLDTGERDFLNARSGPAGPKWQYVRLNADEVAAFGEDAPLRAVILPRRTASGPARIEAVDASHAMTEMIEGNLANKVSSDNVLKSFASIASATPCFVLTYADGGEASRLILETFGP